MQKKSAHADFFAIFHNKEMNQGLNSVAFEFKLPDIGEGIHEGEIVKWFIKPGGEVNEDDVLLEVQNDKAVVEIPSPVKGKVLEVLVEEGTVAVVGDTLIKFDAPGYENLKFKGAIMTKLLKLKKQKKKLLKLKLLQQQLQK